MNDTNQHIFTFLATHLANISPVHVAAPLPALPSLSSPAVPPAAATFVSVTSDTKSSDGISLEDRIVGSCLAGAIGDAIGAAVEGWPWQMILKKYPHVRRHHLVSELIVL